MSIQIRLESPAMPSMPGEFDASSTIAIGQLVQRDIANSKLLPLQNTDQKASVGTIEGICKTNITTAGTTLVLYTPIVDGQYCEVDCTSNTAPDQLFKRHLMTNGGEVTNTSTDIVTTLGLFIATNIVGAASDKKLLGYFIKAPEFT